MNEPQTSQEPGPASNEPTPPPLAQIVVAPVPVLPLAHSLPPYSPPLHGGRPGIITAIGTVSIVVASLSLVMNLVAGLNGLILTIMSQTHARMTAVVQARTAAQATAAAKAAGRANASLLRVGEDGMRGRERAIVIRALKQIRPLNDERTARLEALLAKSGHDIFPVRGANLTVQHIRNNVSESGVLPGADSQEGPAYFVVGEGKIELYDDHVVFFPTGGREPTRIAKGFEELPSGLTAADVKEFIQAVEGHLNQLVSPAQAAALREVLSNENQQLLTAATARLTMRAQFDEVKLLADGSLHIATRSDALIIAPDGKINPNGPPASPLSAGPARISTGTGALAILDAILSILLAIYLLTIGILTLRPTPRGRLLHFIYAAAKLLLVALGTIAWYRFVEQATRNSAGSNALIAFITSWSALGAVYAVALLVVLNLRSVREYYRSAKVQA